DIADAIVASLNAGSFAPEFEAERKYQPVFELQDMQTLHVSVVPKSLAITTAARDSGFFDVAIDIGVQKKVNPDQPDELDALMNLVEQIADHLRMKRLDEAPNAAWLSIANEPVFAPEHLEQWRQFTSVLTVTYRVRR
ncbi:MAG TPA: hypothetical protein VNI78_01475, partial [Vicinamibacterales bacterium]|nr:hypothetical protein [Vicinamibacterales bacterium]